MKSNKDDFIVTQPANSWEQGIWQIERRKLLHSILLGLAGFAGSFYSLKFNNPPFSITITWSYFLPLLAGLMFGWRYGLVAGVLGLGAFFSFFLWPTNGWANVVVSLMFVMWYGWHGYFEEHRRVKPALWNHPLFIYWPFAVIYVVILRTLYPVAFAFNPPFWNPQAEPAMPIPVLDGIITKGVMLMYICLVFDIYILKTPLVRQLFDLEIRQESRQNTKIIMGTFLGSLLMWYTLVIFNRIFIDKTFPQGLWAFGDPHEVIALVVCLSAGFFIGSFVTQYTESRIKAQHELIESEARFRLLAENSTDMISRHTPEGVYLYASPACRAILGYAPEELVGHSAFEFIHPDDLAKIEQSRQMVAEEPVVDVIIFRVRRKDGEYIWLESTSHSIKDKDSGEIFEIQVSSRDITERKRAEEALHTSEARYRQAITAAGAVPYYRDYQSREQAYTFIGDDILQLTGYPATEITPAIFDQLEQECIMRGSLSHLTPDEVGRLSEAGEIQHWACDYRIVTRDGQTRWVSDSAVQVRDENKRRIGVIGILQDITERKLAEEARKESEERYLLLFQNLNLNFMLHEIILDENGKACDYRFLAINPAAEKAVGIKAADMIGKTALELFPGTEPYWIEKFGEVALSGMAIQYENYSQELNKYFDMRIYSPQKGQFALLGLDITERRQAEEARRESEAKYRLIAENTEDVIWVMDVETLCFKYVSPSVMKLRGYTPEEIMAQNLSDTLTPESAKQVEELLAIWIPKFLADPATPLSMTSEVDQPCKDGSIVHTEITSTCFLNERGQPEIVGVTRDITERKRAEDRIKNQLERLNALHNIDNAISSSFNLHTTLNIFLREVTTQLKVDAAAILLFNSHTLTLDHAASCGFHSTALHYTKLGFGEGYAGHVIAERKIVHIADLAETENKLKQALSLADENFVAYVGSPLIAKGQVVGVLEIFQRLPLTPDPEWFDFLEILAGQAAIAIDSTQLFENLQRSNFDLILAYDATIEGWSRAMDLRDHETEGHTQRVTALTMNLAQQLGVPDTEMTHIRRGALLHDIGKMGVPDNILLKPDKLTPEEWDAMRRHVNYAYEMLYPIQYLRPALDIPQYHHEKWDGSGYPNQLKGESIPLAARIFAVVDVWDAVTSDRPYRAAWSKEKAIEYVKSESGKHFDPAVVEKFLALITREKNKE